MVKKKTFRLCGSCAKVRKHFSKGVCRSCYVKARQYTTTMGGIPHTFYMPDGNVTAAKKFLRQQRVLMMKDIEDNPRKWLDETPSVEPSTDYTFREQRIINFFYIYEGLHRHERKEAACVVYNKVYSWNIVFFELINRTKLSLRMIERMIGEKRI